MFLIHCRQRIRELIPTDIVKIQSAAEWKRLIISSYNQDAGIILFFTLNIYDFMLLTG